jgi:hypothetical protein
MYTFRIFILVLIIFLNLPIKAQFSPGSVGYQPSMAEPFLKNKVATQTQYKIEEDGSKTLESVSDYWDNGWLLRITFAPEELGYDEEFIDTMKNEFTYFPNGNLRIKTLYGYDLYPIEQHYQYKKKKLILSNVLAAESREYTYKYGKNKKIAAKIGQSGRFEVDEEGNFSDKMIMVDVDASYYTWDEAGNLITERFTMFGDFYNLIKYTYNAQNQLIEMSVYYDEAPDAAPIFITTFKYSDNGLLESSNHSEDGFSQEYIYEYTYYE